MVHISLNPRGGSERLAIMTMQALSQLGIEFDLTTYEKPNLLQLKKAYGQYANLTIKKIGTLRTFMSDKADLKKYDIIINTHGDMLPYFHTNFSKENAITYCHFPLAKYLIDSNDSEYITILNRINSTAKNNTDFSREFLQLENNSYVKMIKNSTVLTNSEFSRKVILKTFGIDSIILSPPVDVDLFRNATMLLSTNNKYCRNDTILVISRFHPSKKIENAITLAKLLKQNKIKCDMKIVGNLSSENIGYYLYLRQMVQDYQLTDLVTFEINLEFSRLISLMRKSKVYFHSLPGEPFGISTVEAMSAGLIPVVPDIGGHTEFVPSKYQFHTFREGIEVITSALDVPNSERNLISNSVRKFSISNYIQHFQQIVKKMLENMMESKHQGINLSSAPSLSKEKLY